MAVSFVNDLSLIIGYGNGENDTIPVCEQVISHYEWYQFSLIPALLVTISLTVTKHRKKILLDVLHGRPGLIFAMDTLTRSSRISYACAFGATSFLVYRIILEQLPAIEYDGTNKAVRSFVLIGSMFIYGMVFFPLFVSLAVQSVYGYVIGSLYAWMLTAMELYRTFQCPIHSKDGAALLFLRGLPSFLCLLYLCVSLPVRAVMAWRKGHYFHWLDDRVNNTIHDIRDSYVGHHVRDLFVKPKIEPPPETKKERIIAIMMSLVHRFIYQRRKGFRYPARLMTVLFVSFILIYTLTFEFLALGPRILDQVTETIKFYIEVEMGWDPMPGESDEVALRRELLFFVLTMMNVVKICTIVSVVLSAVFAVLNLLHTMSNYRANLFALYKGDHSLIPLVSSSSNTNHCSSSIKYGGFQVGYIVWSYLIQFGILFLVCFLLAIFILLMTYDFTGWLIFFLELIWPVLLTVVLVWLTQFLLSKFVFLQDRGAVLALDNRSVYFNFTYFMFFYNVFLGLFSCILRILKAMAVGVIFLSRLDLSTLPRRFEFIDPGFKAYVGFMHMESAHTHPVVIVFCRLMLLALSDKREREGGALGPSTKQGQQNGRLNGDACYENPVALSPIPGSSKLTQEERDRQEQARRRRVAARFNWHVTYTLLHNPEIRVFRKGYMQLMRQARALGVYIPVSDTQADVNMDKLQEIMAQAKAPGQSKESKKQKYVSEDEDELEEVVMADDPKKKGFVGVTDAAEASKEKSSSSALSLPASSVAHTPQTPPVRHVTSLSIKSSSSSAPPGTDSTNM